MFFHRLHFEHVNHMLYVPECKVWFLFSMLFEKAMTDHVKFVYKNQCFNVISNVCCQCIYWVVIGVGLLLSAWCFRVKIKCTTIDWPSLQFALHMCVFAYTGRTKVT